MFSLGIDKNTSSPASQSRVERFLNSPEAQTMQKAVELNAYVKLDPSAAERFDLIKALDISLRQGTNNDPSSLSLSCEQ